MRFSEEELLYLLDLIAAKLPGGFGYSSDTMIAGIQVKLSVMLQAQRGVHRDNMDPRYSASDSNGHDAQ